MYLTEQLDPQTDPYLKGYYVFKKNILLRGYFYHEGVVTYYLKNILSKLNPNDYEQHPNGGGYVHKSLNIPETEFVPSSTIVVRTDDGRGGGIAWISNGQYHREDGPAVITGNTREWYIHGKPILNIPAELLVYIRLKETNDIAEMVIYTTGALGSTILKTLYGSRDTTGMIKRFRLDLPPEGTPAYSKMVITAAKGGEIIHIKGGVENVAYIEGWLVGEGQNPTIKQLIDKFKAEKGLLPNGKIKRTPIQR